MKCGSIVPQVNMRQLKESVFRFDVTLSRWRPWHYFTQQSAATWLVYMKCQPAPIQQHLSVPDL